MGVQNNQQIGQNTSGKPVQIPEKLKVNFLVIGIVVFVCFLVFGVSGYYFGKQSSKPLQKTNQNQSQSTPTPSIATDTPVSWKPYTNKEYGFEIKYHPNWFITEIRGSINFWSTDPKNGGNMSGFEVQVLPNDKQLSTKDWWFEQNKPLTEYNQQRYSEFVEFYINGVKGIKLNPDARPEGIAMTEVYLANGKWIYNITMSDDENKQNLNEKQINDQILSTFKFVDSSSNTTGNTDNYDKAIQILQTIPEIQTINNSVIKAGNKTFFNPEGENGTVVTVSLRESFSDAHTSRIDTFNIDIISKIVTVEDVVSDREISLDEWRKTVKERFQ